MSDRFDLEDDEHIVTMRMCNLRVEKDDKEELKPFLVVGTGYLYGEDSTCKGRILVFEVRKSEPNIFECVQTNNFSTFFFRFIKCMMLD